MSNLVKKTDNPLANPDFTKSVGTTTPEELFPDSWTLEERENAIEELGVRDGRITNGMWEKIPRKCKESCQELKSGRCKLSKQPHGHPCPEERAFIELLIAAYVRSLKITGEDITSLSLIRDLVDVEILILRKQGVLADSDFFYEKEFYNAETGTVIATELLEHPVVGVDDKLARRKREILKQLAATREQQFKLVGDGRDQHAMARVAELIRKAVEYEQSQEIIDIGPDEWIEAEIEVVEPPDKEE